MLNFLNAIASILRKIFVPLSFLLPWCAPFAGLFALFGSLGLMSDSLASSINGFAASLSGAPLSLYLSQANTVFPLTEALGWALGLMTLKVAATLFRMFKSWVPTMN